MSLQKTTKPTLQDFHIEGVSHITPLKALEAVKSGEAILLDVREEYEWKNRSIALDNVLYHPMSAIIERLKHIPDNTGIIVVCTSGERSSKIANLLNRQGFPDVANLDGGIKEWIKQGLPYESNFKMDCGCSPVPIDSETLPPSDSCGCSSGCGTGCC